MGLRRIWDWLCGLGTMGVVAGPPLLMALATVVDRGQDGLPRVTAFPLALAASDPTVWEACRNSVIVAAIVSAASLILGVLLARAATAARFPGSGILTRLANASGLVLPVFAALGLLGLARWMPRTAAIATPWTALVWAELCWSIPRVAFTVAIALRKIDRSWEDMARLAGASARRRWKTVIWPLVRPAARASADVFLLALFEPGAPLVLGLRRTLAFQAVQAATSGNDLQRAAAMSVIAWMLAVLGRGLIRAWGGPSWELVAQESPKPPTRASWLRGLFSAASLVCIAVFGLIPLFGLIATAFGLFHPPRPSLCAFQRLFHNGEIRQNVLHGFTLGAIAAVVGRILCGCVRQHPRWRRLALSARLVPPLIFGIGLAAAPALCRGLARVLPQQGSSAFFLSSAADQLASDLDSYGSPWLALVIAITAVRLPDLANGMLRDVGQNGDQHIEVARTLGASPFRAWRTVRAPQWMRSTFQLLGWTIILGALDAAPVFVLSPTSEARPIVPGMLLVLADPNGLELASAFALLAVVLPLVSRMLLGRVPVDVVD